MAQLLISENMNLQDNSDIEDMLAGPDEIDNYKGMYQMEEDDETEQKYFENGAHFPYQVLYDRLQELRKKLTPDRLESSETSSRKNHLVNSREGVFPRGGVIAGPPAAESSNYFKKIANINIPQQNNLYTTNLANLTHNPKNDLRLHSTQKISNIKVLQNYKKIKYDDENLRSQNEALCQSNFCKPASINLISSGDLNLNIIMNNNYFMGLNNLSNMNNKSRNKNNIQNTHKPGTGVQVNNISLNLHNCERSQENLVEKDPNEANKNLSPKVIPTKNNSTSRNRIITNPILTNNPDSSSNSKKDIKKVKKLINHYTSFTNDIMNRTESVNKNKDILSSNVNLAVAIIENKIKNSALLKTSNNTTTSDKLSTINKTSTQRPASGFKNLNKYETTDINKIKNEIKTNLSPSVITNYNTKIGRNKNTALQPHNTSNNGLNFKFFSKVKSNEINNVGLLQKNVTNQNNLLISKKNSDKKISDTNELKNTQIENCIPSHLVENKLQPELIDSQSVYEIPSNNKSISHSLINYETNRITPNEDVNKSTKHEYDKGNVEESLAMNNSHSQKINRDSNIETPKLALNDIISNISKNQEKSRNFPRNNLTSTKSNLFSSDKAQSMQNGSYQKNLTFTQANSNVKSLNTKLNIMATSKKNPIVVGKDSKPKISQQVFKNSSYINKTTFGYKQNFNFNKSFNKSKLEKDKTVINATNQTKTIQKQTIDKTSHAQQESKNPVIKNTTIKSPETNLFNSKYDGKKFKTKIETLSKNIKKELSIYPKTKCVINAFNLNKNLTNSNVLNKERYFEKSSSKNLTNTSSDKNSKTIINTFSSASMDKKFKISQDSSVKNK